MLDMYFLVYQDPGTGAWSIRVYDSQTEACRGEVECGTLKEVSKALLNISEEDGSIDVDINSN